jgi:trans-AT polyketide synthase/acyltransferase/oxidoreductase domain-containing protein
MGKSTAFMFSGQGSQYYHMGRELFAHHPVFHKWMLKLNKITQEVSGYSVIDRLYDDKKRADESFDRTLYTHPAIFMAEYAMARVLIEEGIEPDFVLGTSLGEFGAAAVAGVSEVSELLESVIRQAQAFELHCPKGGMLAIICDYSLFEETPLIYDNSELASINFDSHFVISGKTNKLKVIEEFLNSKGIASMLLPVCHAFHSSLADPAASYYMDFHKNKIYQKPQVPLASCLRGKMLTEIPKGYFWDVVRKPIKFPEAIMELEKEQRQNLVYLDLGPGGTMANFAKRNLDVSSQSEVYAVMTPFNQDLKNLAKIKKVLTRKNLSKNDNKPEGGINKMITYVFPGQGSQIKGMGGSLFDEFPEITAKANEILGYSIKELCLQDINRQLGQTQYTQPALYTVNVLSYLKRVKEIGKKPDYVAGHSLGEYSALFAAGAFNFEIGLKLVKRRGELMSQVSSGGMAAVLGLKEEKVEEILRKHSINTIEVANYNTPTQIVFSGPSADVEKVAGLFESAGAMYIPLNVSGAFHSRYMDGAQRKFEEYLDKFQLLELSMPVISNVHARPYKPGELKENLVGQITHSVRWTESIRYLMGLGEMEFEEIGPGDVLTKLVQKIREQSEPLVVTEDEDNKGQEAEQQEPKEQDAGRQECQEKIQEPGRNISLGITATSLGDEGFKKDYNLKYAYVTGGMYRGVASKEMVVKMGKAGMMGFFGAGGLNIEQIESAIIYIQRELKDGQSYGVNMIHNMANIQIEENTIDLFLKYGVCVIEAAAYMEITSSLIRYKVKGLRRNNDGTIHIANRIMAKVSRPEVAEAFLSPAPQRLVEKLLQENIITQEEAEMLKEIPMTDELIVEADSGGHTDGGVAYTLMPAMIKLRDDMAKKHSYFQKIRIGAAGGIGTPEAAAAAFILGADYLLTGSINQCTVEAGTSDVVKDLLQQVNVQDTDYAPAGDMLELGAKVQVLKRGVFFPARANKLYQLYSQFSSLDEIDEKTKKTIQERYFMRSFDQIYEEGKSFYTSQEIDKAERDPKHKMAMVFKWYFSMSSSLAMKGDTNRIVDFQVHCGPALGAFNQWIKGTYLENWRNRHSDIIAEKIMTEAGNLLNERFSSLTSHF